MATHNLVADGGKDGESTSAPGAQLSTPALLCEVAPASARCTRSRVCLSVVIPRWERRAVSRDERYEFDRGGSPAWQRGNPGAL
eukprot:5188391-Pleurochrysis_carterae.AAC.2